MTGQLTGARAPAAVTYQQLCRLAEDIEGTAEGQGFLVRADIADEQITVRAVDATPLRGRILTQLGHQTRAQDDRAVALVGGRIHHPGLGLCRTADLAVLTEEAYERSPDDFAVFGPEFSAAFEVVARSGPDPDSARRLQDYQRMGIHSYVVIDPRDGRVTTYDWDNPRTHACEDSIQIGEWTLDTGPFPRYR